jgi:hypothetical protein
MVAATLAGVALVTGVSAQHLEFLQAQKANARALREYTWKSRTELALKGETMRVLLEQVRFDIDGQLQKTPIGGSPDGPDPTAARGRAGGPVRQRVVARKRSEFKDLLDELAALAGSYAHLSQDRLDAFARRAVVSAGAGIETGSLRLQGSDVVVPGDAMTVWVDPATFNMRRVTIATMFEMKPVELVADYRSLGNGVTYQARTALRYPDRQIEITVETFEYVQAGR